MLLLACLPILIGWCSLKWTAFSFGWGFNPDPTALGVLFLSQRLPGWFSSGPLGGGKGGGSEGEGGDGREIQYVRWGNFTTWINGDGRVHWGSKWLLAVIDEHGCKSIVLNWWSSCPSEVSWLVVLAVAAPLRPLLISKFYDWLIDWSAAGK